MADRTIIITPLPHDLTEAAITAQFKAYDVRRIALDRTAQKAYVELNSADDIESLGLKYSDYKVLAFQNAEIDCVSPDFQWPQEGTKAATIPVKEDCLLRIFNC